MSTATLSLKLNLPRLDVGELMFLLSWAATRVETFPKFSKWIALLASGELARRQEGGLMEACTIPLPDLRGAEAADFLQGSYCMARQPLTEALAAFIDDAHQKIVCDVSGFLEWQAEQ